MMDDTQRPTFDPSTQLPSERGIFGLPHSVQEARVIVLPSPFAATSPGGHASSGPEALLKASRQVERADPELGSVFEPGIHMLPTPEAVTRWHVDARENAKKILAVDGDILDSPALIAALSRVNILAQNTHEWVHDTTRFMIKQGKLVAVVGGDPSVAFGTIRAHASRTTNMGVLHVGPCAGLLRAHMGFAPSHRSLNIDVLDNIVGVHKIVHVGANAIEAEERAVAHPSDARVVLFSALELEYARLAGETLMAQCERIIAPLPNKVFVALDMSALAEASSGLHDSPAAFGLTWSQMRFLLRALHRSGRVVVGASVSDIVQGPHGESRCAAIAARALYALIGWMLVGKGLLDSPRSIG